VKLVLELDEEIMYAMIDLFKRGIVERQGLGDNETHLGMEILEEIVEQVDIHSD